MRQRVRARERFGDAVSILLIMVGAVGLIVYLLYLRNPSNAVFRYALLTLIVMGMSLAIVLAALYLTGELNNHERGTRSSGNGI
jgi:disulfide bond formation protein DsbB